jgi:hypothetical protein
MSKTLADYNVELYVGSGDGIEKWFTDMPPMVTARINICESVPISFTELNQLLTLSHEASVSRDFFGYYWTDDVSDLHPYDVEALPYFDKRFYGSSSISSIDHLLWGVHRIFLDGLLFFGNVRQFFRELRNSTSDELETFFGERFFDNESLRERGAYMPLQDIPRDDRYLIAEIACKTYESQDIENMIRALKERAAQARKDGKKKVFFKDLIDSEAPKEKAETGQYSLPLNVDIAKFTLSELVDEEVEAKSDEEIDARIDEIKIKFKSARERALRNTDMYLSMVPDLDVYVATSMRTREDFRQMADRCQQIFGSTKLKPYNIRFFDPTLSAAQSHEDKGLIECLMVKACKVLLYMAGVKDSYGKDSEAAMALSLGKPVIFLCDTDTRRDFLRDVHPLSRLIEFSSGVPTGAIVTDNVETAIDLIDRIFTNTMQYELELKKDADGRPRPYHIVKEKLTGSSVRVQTDFQLLRETFWNHYHSPYKRH